MSLSRHLVHAAAALVLVSAALVPTQGLAAGAVAVGQTRAGDSYGVAWSYDSYTEAKQVAMSDCRRSKYGASACRIVRTFHDECAAFAFAPENHNGFGWAVAPSAAAARVSALAMCRESSDDPKDSGCEIDRTACDE